MLKSTSPSCRKLVFGSALVSLALSALAGTDQPAAASANAPRAVPLSTPKKPAWLTDLSLSLKESYDNNVFLSEVGNTADRTSWVTTISPKIGFNFAPLLGDQKTLQALTIAYAPDFAIYHNESSESYNAHRLAVGARFKSDAWSFILDEGFNYIDGNKQGPAFSGGRSAYATSVTRERRAQYQDKGKVTLQYDQPKWFVRPTASVVYYDLLTDILPKAGAPAGYDNYADRYDANAGADLGYKVKPQLALTLGYRYGHQYQQQYSPTVDAAHLSSPSDYHRVLLGVEGKPWKWLTVAIQGGPDFRSYDPNTATHKTPVFDFHPVKYYGEASLTLDATANDAVTFKYKQWQWVSSTGKIPYFDSLYDLSYRHKFNKNLSLDLGERLASSDYTSSSVSGRRKDWQYTTSAGLNYNINANLSVAATYSLDLGRNMQDKLTATAIKSREYDHHLISLGATYKF
jgi:hypothetical protein